MSFRTSKVPEKHCEDYEQSIRLPASRTFATQDFFEQGGEPKALTTVLEDAAGVPIAWVVSNVLSKEECAKCRADADSHGLDPPQKLSIRTAKRTIKFEDQGLSDMVAARLSQEFLELLHELEGQPIVAVHPNWRMVGYEAGESFPVHSDQSDMVRVKKESGPDDWHFSSHTLLINLSDDGSFQGGGTRFFPKFGDYTESVDVFTPQGFALVFKQKGLLHCGAQVASGRKMVAQAGMMRLLGPKESLKYNKFLWGPGMDHLEKKMLASGELVADDHP